MKPTTEQLVEIYKKLPQDLLDALFNVDTSDVIEKVGRKHALTIDKIGELGNETGMVMLGVTHPNEFISNLADRLKTDKETARAIANEINEQIFKPVRDSLRKIHDIRDEEEEIDRQDHQGPSLMRKTEREDILREIEKDHSQRNEVQETKEEMPAIMQGVVSANPFDAKMGGEIHIAPTEEKTAEPILPEKPKNKYPEFDPYREAIE